MIRSTFGSAARLALLCAGLAGCVQTTKQPEPALRRDPHAGFDLAPAETSRDPNAPDALHFVAQPGWKELEPASKLRAVQYELPGADGAEEASLVVYYFGATGGSWEQNLERWLGQIEQPDGSPSEDAAAMTSRELHGLHLRTVDVAGTFVAETSPGSGEYMNEPGSRLIATMIEGAKAGPYYVKLTGPEPTVARWRAAYDAFLEASSAP